MSAFATAPYTAAVAGVGWPALQQRFGRRAVDVVAWLRRSTVALQLWTALHARPHAAATIDSEPGAASAVREDAVTGARPDAKAAARFRELMLPHLDAAYNLARFLCRDADAAEDVVQEAFLRAYRSFATFRGGSPRAWILSIVRNCHRDWWSDRRRRQAMESVRDADDAGADGADTPRDDETPEVHLLRRSEAEEVRRHLGSLPEPFREVLVLRELEELSYREIAEVTATPVGTVMSRLARARKLFVAAWTGRTEAEEDAR